ncbi:hypothetical protein GGQ84_002320 [Desulfitispora alkaliphila]|uniref:ABC transporter substrate-binding protein n=1 Tax=Desulfitispora alkaliphila TaxID=622674 RepID=UPI003D2370DA
MIVTKDQSDTASLNPTRKLTAAHMALADYKRTNMNSGIEHHYITYTGSEEEGYRKAREYLETNQAKAVALVGDFNTTGTEQTVKLAAEYSLPHLSFFATNEELFIDNPWSFSYRERLIHETDIMIKILSNQLAADKIAVVVCDLINIAQRWEDLQSNLEEFGIDVYFSNTVSSNENDFTQQIDYLNELQDEYDAIVLFLSSRQVEHFLQQLYISGLNKPIALTGISLSPESLRELEGIDLNMYSYAPQLYLQLSQGENHALQEFAKEYRVAIGYHQVDTMGPRIYDGLTLLYDMIEQSDRKEEIKWRLNEYNQERMVGCTSFDIEGRLQSSTYRIVNISNGSYIEVTNGE